ncbi:hypothetical protein C8Q78DRAFT_585542 [Trametes maxima]|nr:hypothetical protein C8Q78DRAFT_585542 [Trametes maxima]
MNASARSTYRRVDRVCASRLTVLPAPRRELYSTPPPRSTLSASYRHHLLLLSLSFAALVDLTLALDPRLMLSEVYSGWGFRLAGWADGRGSWARASVSLRLSSLSPSLSPSFPSELGWRSFPSLSVVSCFALALGVGSLAACSQSRSCLVYARAFFLGSRLIV